MGIYTENEYLHWGWAFKLRMGICTESELNLHWEWAYAERVGFHTESEFSLHWEWALIWLLFSLHNRKDITTMLLLLFLPCEHSKFNILQWLIPSDGKMLSYLCFFVHNAHFFYTVRKIFASLCPFFYLILTSLFGHDLKCTTYGLQIHCFLCFYFTLFYTTLLW